MEGQKCGVRRQKAFPAKDLRPRFGAPFVPLPFVAGGVKNCPLPLEPFQFFPLNVMPGDDHHTPAYTLQLHQCKGKAQKRVPRTRKLGILKHTRIAA